MNWKNQSYWLKSGMVVMIFGVILSFILIGLAMAEVIGFPEGIVSYLALPLVLVIMDLGMRGTPAGWMEALIKWVLAVLVLALQYFVVGSILGYFHSKFKGNKKK